MILAAVAVVVPMVEEVKVAAVPVVVPSVAVATVPAVILALVKVAVAIVPVVILAPVIVPVVLFSVVTVPLVMTAVGRLLAKLVMETFFKLLESAESDNSTRSAPTTLVLAVRSVTRPATGVAASTSACSLAAVTSPVTPS